MKLNIGCGKDIKEGFINCDIQDIKGADQVFDCGELTGFETGSADLIFSNAFFEHLYLYQQVPFLKSSYRVLKDQGYLIILGVPDFDSICKAYVSKEIVQTQFGTPFDLYQAYRLTHGDFEDGVSASIPQFHKALFTQHRLDELIKASGFTHYAIFNYDCPEEFGNLALGIIATKKQNLDQAKCLEVLNEFSTNFARLHEVTFNDKNFT